MPRSPSLVALLLLGTAAGARPPQTADALLAGRVAGKPQSCINRGPGNSSSDSRVFDDHAMSFGGYGSTVYLNRPPHCENLTPDRGYVSVTPSTSLCRGDIFNVVDFTSGMSYGSCAFGDFVPYTKPKR